MPYCTNCGARLERPVRFCTGCGNPLPKEGDGQPPPAPAGSETVLGVIGGLDLKRSLLKSEPVNLVITGRRTLCVPVAAMLETAKQKAGEEAAAEGKWLIGKWKAKAEVAKAGNFSAYFRNMTPDEIVKGFPSAAVIPDGDLVSITIRHRNLDLEGEDISSTVEDWPIVMKTRTAEYALVGRTDPVQQFRLNPAVDALLGDRLRILF